MLSHHLHLPPFRIRHGRRSWPFDFVDGRNPTDTKLFKIPSENKFRSERRETKRKLSPGRVNETTAWNVNSSINRVHDSIHLAREHANARVQRHTRQNTSFKSVDPRDTGVVQRNVWRSQRLIPGSFSNLIVIQPHRENSISRDTRLCDTSATVKAEFR